MRRTGPRPIRSPGCIRKSKGIEAKLSYLGRALMGNRKRENNPESLPAVKVQVNLHATLIVVSDHGFHTWRKRFNTNKWVVENGYMVLRVACGCDGDSSGRDRRTGRSAADGFADCWHRTCDARSGQEL